MPPAGLPAWFACPVAEIPESGNKMNKESIVGSVEKGSAGQFSLHFLVLYTINECITENAGMYGKENHSKVFMALQIIMKIIQA